MSTKLDANQVIKNSYDPVTQSLKTVPGAETAFSIELSSTDGDSVTNVPNGFQETTATITSSSTGVISTEFSLSGMKTINLYTKTLTNITGAQVLTLEISPTDSGDVWIATSLTITPNATAPTVVAGTPASIVARRGRVRTAAAISAGTYTLHIVAQAV